MTTSDLDLNGVKALLNSPLGQNQRLGLAILCGISIPKEASLQELMANSNDKLLWCKEFDLEKEVSIIKLEEGFCRRKISLAPFVNVEKLYFNQQYWSKGQVPFASFKKLKTLSLTGHQLYEFPKNIHMLQQLETLYLGKNKFTKIPAQIAQLEQLKVLILSRNRLKSLPTHLFSLQQLYNLNLSNNHLTTLPRDIGLLQGLELLNLSSNKLKELPNSIGELRQLKQLNLNANQLSTLPNSIRNLKQLEKLSLKGNPITKNKGLINRLQTWLPHTDIQVNKK